MCGIIGTVNLSLSSAALDSLRHRGPDGEGLVSVTCGAHQVHLGHRRLAILDLSEHGAQPMFTEDGRHCLVFNGEIYNHGDIRRRLAPRTYRGHSDTETLLWSLASSGVREISQLNGIFAFAYLDIGLRRLFLVRDPFGIKPLYYSATKHGLCFSSELTPLLSFVVPEIDPANLATALKLRFVPSPRTLYKSVNRVRPGHCLEVDLSSDVLSIRELPFVTCAEEGSSGYSDLESASERYGEHFESAVSRQLMSDVEIGVLLSGGVDSALVAASAQRKSDRPLKAFTVGFTEISTDDVDEVAAASETARFLGMEHYVARMGFGDFLDNLRQCVRIVEEPLATTSIVPMHFLAELAGQQVKVVLSGQGADELLGGYRRYQLELLRKFLPPPIAKAGMILTRALGLKNDSLLRGLRALSKPDFVSRFISAHEVFSTEEIERLTGATSDPLTGEIDYAYRTLGCSRLSSTVERMMALDTRLGLADDLLLYTDKITMRQSLECRVPFLDAELVAFIETLPVNYRLRLNRTKLIHKAYARRALPSSIVSRPKKGFQSPTRDWFKNRQVISELLLDTSSAFASHFDVSAIIEIIKAHQKGLNRERQIFLLLSLYFLLEDIGAPRGRPAELQQPASP